MRFIARAPAHDPVTPGALAAHLGVSTAAVTGVIRRLREGGFVVVAPNPADARSKVLRASLRELHSPADRLSSRVEAIASDFSDSELDAVARFLVQLAAEAEDVGDVKDRVEFS
ncbi:MAG: MarR family transcriptional regulator [Microbacterium sp.]|nr:MarR family transcriptional regulator [Microbacterium sp.]